MIIHRAISKFELITLDDKSKLKIDHFPGCMSAMKPSTIQINEDRYYVGEFKLKCDLMYVSQNSLIRPRFQFGKVDQKREISF